MPAPRDVLPPARPHLLSLPKRHHQPEAKYQIPEPTGDVLYQTTSGSEVVFVVLQIEVRTWLVKPSVYLPLSYISSPQNLYVGG